MINLNANGGIAQTDTTKHSLIKYIDAVNSSNMDPLTQQATRRYRKLQLLTAEVASGSADPKAFHSIVTSSGSEANCLFIKAVVSFNRCQNKKDCPLHVISSPYEHKSIQLCL